MLSRSSGRGAWRVRRVPRIGNVAPPIKKTTAVPGRGYGGRTGARRGGGGAAGGGGRAQWCVAAGNAAPLRIQPFEADQNPVPAGRGERPAADEMAQFRQMAQQFGIAIDDTRPRVVMQFSSDPSNLLLSGTLANGQFLANRAAALDHP